MSKHYVIFSSQISLQPDSAHEIHDVMCANAVANLGYSGVLVYPETQESFANPLSWISPFQPRKPPRNFVEFYNVQDQLKVSPLLIPKFVKDFKNKLVNNYNLIYRYYLPFRVFPLTKIVHTRDWNCVKSAVSSRVPVIYERHYFQKRTLEPKVAQSPFLKIGITQSEPIRKSLIEAGMPAEKVVCLPNGFSPVFLVRKPQEAAAWRQELLASGKQYLVVYSGALYRFKGVDLLIDVAGQLPHIQFAITGGTESQVNAYRQLAKDKQVENINFLGWILPRSRLVSLLQAADILAHPHCSGKSANFTNPVKFFQYMASGTPIAATEIPPLTPFKSAGIAVAWCPPDSDTELARCIEYVLEKYPRKLEGYSENIEFSRNFSWEERALKIIDYVQ